MLALCRPTPRSLAAFLWIAALEICAPAVASDVYFPATSAYNRRNYDPFDQTATKPAATTASTAPTVDSGDIQLSSEVRLLGSDPFHGSSSVGNVIPLGTAPPVALPPVAPAGYQPVGPGAPESLPTPDGASPRGVPSDEPGADWRPKPLGELSTNTVLPGGVLPRDYWSERSPQHQAFYDPCGATRGWPVNNFNWVASCLCHNPLYFEEVNLERYGYGCGCYGPCCTTCVQSLSSAAHFFGNVVALPYKMGVDCPMECDYTLGHYRPGSCPPWRWHCCSRCGPLGAASAGGVAIGLIFLIP
jgi:hypothetical protein